MHSGASTTLEEMAPVVRSVFSQPDLEVEASLSDFTVAGWDSLSEVRLLAALEERFGIRFDEAELGDLRTLGDIAQLIDRHRAASAQSSHGTS